MHQGKGSITTQKRDRAPAYFAISKAQRNSHLVHGSKRYGYPNSIYTDLPFTLKATHKSSMQAIVWPFPPPLHPPYMQNYVFPSRKAGQGMGIIQLQLIIIQLIQLVQLTEQ